MFYSHEILTSRKYGVATVWLVATLGAKPGSKRITRKQILDVDITKACRTITDPAAPMALRLQGSLLLGVSRVFLQQAGYILSDAQGAQHTMLMLLRSVQHTALDPDAGKAQPEQLMLQDDPSFLPEFILPSSDIMADLNLNFDFNFAQSGDSQSLTPFGSQLSQCSTPVGGLVLPSSSSPHAAPGFRLEGDDGPSNLGDTGGLFGAEDSIEMPEPNFTFGDDGEIIDLPVRNLIARTPGPHPGSAMQSDAGASERVRREHEEGQQAGVQIPIDPMDLDLPIFGDDLPEGEAFSSAGHTQASEHSEQVESTSSVSAPMKRKRRIPRTVPRDSTTEIENKEIADWRKKYLHNMQAASQRKMIGRAVQQAKKNAEFYVFSGGLGGIAQQLLGKTGSHPFDMFMGDDFYEAVTGVSRKRVTGKKRDRDSGIDDTTQGESRNVRQKTSEPEDIGRGIEDDGVFMPGGDDTEVEMPREAATALDDQQMFSAMPWNISASKRGSSVVPRSALSGRAGSMDVGRRGSRMVSASPLHGRGQPLDLDPLQHLESDGDLAFGGDDFAMPDSSSQNSELAAAPKTSTRIHEALSAEGENFLTFVAEAISEKSTRKQIELGDMSHSRQADTAADIQEINFEELLPPAENTKIIACQGLMMVLGLGSKGMLDVQQPEHFGQINMKLTPKGKAAQAVEGNDEKGLEVNEHQDEQLEQDKGIMINKHESQHVQQEEPEDEGHFQEQFAAGHGARADDDQVVLYDD
ncbi:R8 protein [Coniothyrium glycines]